MTETKDGRLILTTPITADDVKALHAGDVIYLSGDVTACRDAAHKRTVSDDAVFPADLRGGALLHAGPIVRRNDDGRYEIVSIGPTTSMRMEDLEYDFVRVTGARLIIGKGGMGPKTAAACSEFGAVHCAAPAGCAVVGALSVDEVTGAEWLDLGMPEAVWNMRVTEFGPLIVTIDTSGTNYFEDKKVLYNERREIEIKRAVDAFRRG